MADVVVDRLALGIRAAAAPARAHAIERRLRDAVSRELERVLEQRIGGLPDPHMLFIDTLEIACDVSTAWDDERIVASIAARLDRAVTQALRDNDACIAEGVHAFADRAQWLAAFLLERVDGSAHRRWWFEVFDGLRPLAASAAIRTVLENEGDDATRALAKLTPAGVLRVRDALGDADVARVLAKWRARPSRNSVPVARLWAAAGALDGGSLRALWLACVEIERNYEGAIDQRTVTLLAAFADMQQAIVGMDGAAPAPEATSHALAAWCAGCGVDPRFVDGLASDEVAQVATLVERTLAARQGGDDVAPSRATLSPARWTLRSRNGGVFPLAVVCGWLGWPAAWRRMLREADHTGEEAEALTSALLLAVCAAALRPHDGSQVLADAALHEAFQARNPEMLLASHASAVAHLLGEPSARVTPNITGARCDRHIAAAARKLMRALSERVPGCRGSSGDYLRRNLLATHAVVSIQSTADSASVVLTRAPLHVLLLLAGLTRGTIRGHGWAIAFETAEDA